MSSKQITRKAERTSLDLKAEQIKKLKRCFPEVVADSKINFEMLKAVLGEEVDSSVEKFSFTWAGKSGAIKNVLIPSKATLRPDKKESVNFDKTENIFIEGDNLETLKLLQKSYFESIKMIYIDPPYNTGNDFVYRDDFKDSIKNYLEQTGQVDSEGNRLQTNTESNGRFHSDWLTMLYPRLKLAWNLLKDTGVIFVNIGNRELHNLLIVMNEVFGEENFIETIIWRKKSGGGQQDDFFITEHDYIVCYAKDKSVFRLNDKCVERSAADYKLYDKKKKTYYKQVKLAKWGSAALREDRPTMHFPLVNPDGKKTYPIAPDGRPGRWRYGKVRIIELVSINSIDWEKKNGAWIPYEKQYAPKKGELAILKERSIFYDLVENTEGANELTEIFGVKDIFSNPKPSDLIKHLILLTTSAHTSDIVLDFFAGSCSTAHAVLGLNSMDAGGRKFIMIQLPEKIDETSAVKKFRFKTIADIGKERIRRVIQMIGEERKSELELNPKSSGTLGFKAFRLDKSNYPDNQFEYDPKKSKEENEKALREYLKKAAQSNLFGAGNEMDILYENILKEGLSLNAQISESTIGENKVHHVGDGKSELFICLDNKILDTAVEALTKPEFKDKILICFDAALNDSAKANLGLHLSLRTI